jgi:sortase A
MAFTSGGIRRRVGQGAVIAGASLLVCAAWVTARGWIWQERHADLFATATHPVTAPPRSIVDPLAPVPPRRGEAFALLRVPRLGIETVVVEGTDAKSLSLGPGHLEGSALPGAPDNCIIAGHRDGPFGRLRTTRPGDILEIAGQAGALTRYRVESVEIVGKDDTWVLAPSREPILTLVTCYPFHYVGHAPKRFVVRAALLDDSPAADDTL